MKRIPLQKSRKHRVDNAIYKSRMLLVILSIFIPGPGAIRQIVTRHIQVKPIFSVPALIFLNSHYKNVSQWLGSTTLAQHNYVLFSFQACYKNVRKVQ